MFTLRNKTDAFKKKLAFWKNNEQKSVINTFPCLQDVLANAFPNTEELFAFISQHLQKLFISFGQYFSDKAIPRKKTFGLSILLQKILICAVLTLLEKNRSWGLSCDTTLISKHKNLPLSRFLFSAKDPEPSSKAVGFLLIFLTTYLGEKNF